MKRVFYIFSAVFVIVALYIGAYYYLKLAGVKMLQDQRGIIKKGDDTYLHFKVLDTKLLESYGIDLRLYVVDESVKGDNFVKAEYKKMLSKPRKGAKKVAFVLLNAKDKKLFFKSNKNYDKRFVKDLKNLVKEQNISKSAIKVVESFLDNELKKVKN